MAKTGEVMEVSKHESEDGGSKKRVKRDDEEYKTEIGSVAAGELEDSEMREEQKFHKSKVEKEFSDLC